MSDKLKSALKWGVMGGVASAILGLMFYILNLDSDSAVKKINLT